MESMQDAQLLLYCGEVLGCQRTGLGKLDLPVVAACIALCRASPASLELGCLLSRRQRPRLHERQH
jgi:hypothetical protein